MLESNLPRLLYIGDVAVESTVAGSALIYRLLQKYPTNKLCIVEGNTSISQSDKRLNKIEYQVLKIGNQRLINSRLNRLYSSYLYLTTRKKASQLTEIIKTFKPEAILTVAHGFSWLTAAEVAKKYQLPLNFIVHDDLPSYIPILNTLKPKLEQEFTKIYRQAKSRLCVSPYMVECYQERYGVTGTVLYPSRAADLIEYSFPNTKKNKKNYPFTFAYAGSINSLGQAKNLVDMAKAIAKFNSRLIIYAQLNSEFIKCANLKQPNIEIRDIVSSLQLANTLRNEADVLFIPMNFDLQVKSNMQLCFPSKLTDYTAVGVPLLIWGEDYCSAVRWAKENPGVAEVVEKKSVSALEIAIEKLVANYDYRDRLAKNALIVGKKYFSYHQVSQCFYQSIQIDNNAALLKI